MDKPRMTDQEAASHAIKDPYFAQKILTGEEDYPAVRNAILADMYDSSRESEPADAGFALFNRRTVDTRPAAGPMGPCYVRYYPKKVKLEVWDDWRTLPKPNLAALATPRP